MDTITTDSDRARVKNQDRLRGIAHMAISGMRGVIFDINRGGAGIATIEVSFMEKPRTTEKGEQVPRGLIVAQSTADWS